MSKTKANKPAQFFDARAPGYRESVSSDPFLHYFHYQRLESAIEGQLLEGKRLLDIGAGTGILYDFLQQEGIQADYQACDISGQMLAHSRIPPNRRHLGRASELFETAPGFDGIFMLGLSTYLSLSELQNLLEFCSGKLNPGGFIAVSFTHRKSLDFRLRQLVPTRWIKIGVLGSGLKIAAYSLKQVPVPPTLLPEKTHWLNQTVPFINRLLPRLSVFFAKIRKRILPGFLLPFFSSDFLLILRKKTGGISGSDSFSA
ncbi:MAG: class I SAM-dependent methyltransferase [Saprospiraceae bacterium]|nr:class I SAM-dependent methyltransferase [Saprospiraceae bacterium]